MRTLSDYNYNGPSMRPLLQPGDGLIVDPETPFDALRKGDVICFKSPEKPIHVTHRIVGVTPGGCITRGDNNTGPDPYWITPELEPRLLTHVRRGDKTIRIRGGAMGMLTHWKNRARRAARRLASPLKQAAAAIADSGVFYRLYPMDKNLSVRRYRRDGSESRILFHGTRRVGRLKEDGAWHIKIPWRFFIDPGKLDRVQDLDHPSSIEKTGGV
ncbi:MAG: signal peptidase I [Desulfobacterales bacterium]|nr:signal peptidase I [Desulfobacterales bacterium]